MNEDLGKKNKSGYTSNEEFNRALNEAQLTLMSYYHHLFQATNHLADAIGPFVKTQDAVIWGQLITYPTDYRHLISVLVENSKNIPGSEPEIRQVTSTFVKSGEIDSYLSSYVLRPNLSKDIIYHSFENGRIKIWPKVNSAKLRYLRTPAEAERVVTIDSVNDLEVYDSVNTTHLEWPAQEQPNFVDLLLLDQGLAVKESALIQWAAQRNQLIKQSVI